MSEPTLMTDAPTNTDAPTSTNAADASAPAANQQTANQADAGNQDAKPDAATDGTQSQEGDKPDGADGKDAPQGAPESYEDFTLPEGVELDATLTDEIKSVAKDLNLPQEQAQKLADLAADRIQAMRDQQTQALQEARTRWADEAKADKEFGGAKLDENLAVAAKAMKAFGSPELVNLLNETGFGNHPELIRAFYRAGKAISEDVVVPSGTNVKTGAKDPAKSLYPNQQS